MNNNNTNKNTSNNTNIKVKRPANPKYIPKHKYFKVSTRDSSRIKNIKEGMNHLFDLRNRELEEAFLQEATQYAERVLEETRRIQWTEEEDHEATNVIFNNSLEESETLNSEEVWELNERIQAEDQEEYDKIRAEMEEEEAEANKHN